MTMDKENNKLIDRYLGDGEAEFDRILAEREWNRHRRIIPTHQAAETPLTPIQIAEGIQQMMLLDIGDIDSIVAKPEGSHDSPIQRFTDSTIIPFGHQHVNNSTLHPKHYTVLRP